MYTQLILPSVSVDGSVRVFDLRDKEHSTIIVRDMSQILLLFSRILSQLWNYRGTKPMSMLLHG